MKGFYGFFLSVGPIFNHCGGRNKHFKANFHEKASGSLLNFVIKYIGSYNFESFQMLHNMHKRFQNH